MKKRSMLILFLVISVVFLIYMKTRDKAVYYVNFSDEYTAKEYTYEIVNEIKMRGTLEKFLSFSYEDARITDLTNIIRENEYIYCDGHKQTIQNALIKADMLTISIGTNDLEYGITKYEEPEIYNYMDTLLLDLETFFEEVKTYTKEQVFFIKYPYEENKYLAYFYEKVEKLCKKYSFAYIDIKDKKKIPASIKESIFAKFTFP